MIFVTNNRNEDSSLKNFMVSTIIVDSPFDLIPKIKVPKNNPGNKNTKSLLSCERIPAKYPKVEKSKIYKKETIIPRSNCNGVLTWPIRSSDPITKYIITFNNTPDNMAVITPNILAVIKKAK